MKECCLYSVFKFVEEFKLSGSVPENELCDKSLE
jgi:hypothetical protein